MSYVKEFKKRSKDKTIYKVAYFKKKEIAREKAIEPFNEGNFNVDELSSYFDKISRTVEFNNSQEIQLLVQYEIY